MVVEHEDLVVFKIGQQVPHPASCHPGEDRFDAVHGNVDDRVFFFLQHVCLFRDLRVCQSAEVSEFDGDLLISR